MSRYLFYTSYLGTRFCGSQYQKTFIGAQNVLNNALAIVLKVPINVIRTNSASRTDTGVHALRTTYTTKLLEKIDYNHMAFNLKFQSGDKILSLPYDPDHLCAAVNHVLKDMDFDMRILGCRTVADGFCPRRHAQSRSYMYRLLVLKPEFDHNPDLPPLLCDPCAFAPLLEKDRSWAINSDFDPEKFYQAAKTFEGAHDFKSFSCTRSLKDGMPPVSTQRSIKLVEVLQGNPLIDPRYEPLSNRFQYIDVLVHAKSFVYRQIRKMIAFMVAVGQNRATCQDLKWLLDNPDENNWQKYGLEMAPAGGLYLLNITYDPRDFENPNPSYAFESKDDKVDLNRQDEDLIDDEEAESFHAKDETGQSAAEKIENLQTNVR